MESPAGTATALTTAELRLRENPRQETYRQIIYVVLGCLLALCATWVVNELYHLGGAFGRLERINPLFVQESVPIPPDAVKYFYWESRDFGEAATLVVGKDEVSVEDVVGQHPAKTIEQFLHPLPPAGTDYRVFAEGLSSRGYITVIQQPTKENNYTAKIRIDDPYGEHSEYKVALYFQPVELAR